MHRLFFALIPDSPALAAIERVAAGLREANTVRGRWIAPEKYHLTARFLGDHDDGCAVDVIARATAAAAQMQVAEFSVVLDRVTTFRGRYRAPCVLRCSPQCDVQVRELSDRFAVQLSRAGFDDHDQRRFQPHLTIAYVDRMIEPAIEVEPISWRVREIALVDSHHSGHAVLARWPTRA
jgi:2'-5' RNA ligase